MRKDFERMIARRYERTSDRADHNNWLLGVARAAIRYQAAGHVPSRHIITMSSPVTDSTEVAVKDI